MYEQRVKLKRTRMTTNIKAKRKKRTLTKYHIVDGNVVPYCPRNQQSQLNGIIMLQFYVKLVK